MVEAVYKVGNIYRIGRGGLSPLHPGQAEDILEYHTEFLHQIDLTL